MTPRLLLPITCAAIAFAAPLPTSPSPRARASTNFGAMTSTLFYGVGADEAPPTDPTPTPAPEPAPEPEFVVPQSGTGWLDFVFQYMYVGLGDEEAALLRAVLLPQYERLAAVWQPVAAPAAPEPPAVATGDVMVALSTSPQPVSLRIGSPAPAVTAAGLDTATPSKTTGSVDFALLSIPPPSVSNPVPEPSTLALLTLGLAGLAARRRRA